MSFTLRRDSKWFDEQKHLGDVYRASLEGSGIMLRMLIEFLGIKSDKRSPGTLTKSDKDDAILGKGMLKGIEAVDPVILGSTDNSLARFLAKMHDEAAKRTAHPAFNKLTQGIDPEDLRIATKWVVTEIWNRCYDPSPITIHCDLFRLMNGGKWENIPFQPAEYQNKNQNYENSN